MTDADANPAEGSLPDLKVRLTAAAAALGRLASETLGRAEGVRLSLFRMDEAADVTDHDDRRAREWLAQSQAEAIAQRHERDLYADDDAPAVQAHALAEARQWLADLGVGAHGHERAIFAALDNPPTCDHLPPGAVEVSREVFDAPSGDWCVMKCMRGGTLVVRYFTVPAPAPDRPTLPTTPGSVIDVTTAVTFGSDRPTQLDRPCRMIRLDADSLDHWIDTVGERWMDDEIVAFVVVLDARAES